MAAGQGAAPSTGKCESKPARLVFRAGKILENASCRRGGRAVECTGLENQQGLTPFVGSNPTLSARHEKRPVRGVFYGCWWNENPYPAGIGFDKIAGSDFE